LTASRKVLALEELPARLAAPRAAGRSVALANGLFDILHVGHLRYLQEARAQADLLVVGVNSDASARRLKGPSRPVNPQDERAELLAGLACVDLVTIFDGPTAEELLRAVRPDVHCKGTDYTADTVPEAALARELGIRVAIVGDSKRHSTRDIIRRLQAGDQG
jgi:rfaE bifunctional protein nucleotidyltransferase chain/domain